MLEVVKPHEFERRLTSVAFADVAGFSRLISLDDSETTRRWQLMKSDIMLPLMQANGGRLVEIAGDALLIEFSSVVYALRWAIEVQDASNNFDKSGDEFSLKLRISVNVDDVIVDERALQGDGVNIAARIHHAAEPGQIVVTNLVKELVGNRLPVSFQDLGTPKLKNIDRMVRVFSVKATRDNTASVGRDPYLEWSSKPSLAVMPFRSIGQSETSDYFSQGITEDIIAGLSRSRSIHVIARSSMWRYADRKDDVAKVARELGVGYVLDGSVRRHQKQLRISAELVDIAQNNVVWTHRFDGDNSDIFDFQDQITTSIVGALEPKLRSVEFDRIKLKPTESLDAYHCVLKAQSIFYEFSDQSFRLTKEALDRAVELDPNYAQAYAYMAWRLNYVWGENRSTNPEQDKKLAVEYSQKAIQLDPEDVFALCVAGHITSFVLGKPREGLELYNTALAIDGNSAFAWAQSGISLAYCGEADAAIERLRNAWRLSPFDRMLFYWWSAAGVVEFVAGRYDESITWFMKSRRANPRLKATMRILAASLALSGDTDQAIKMGKEFMLLEPTFRITEFIGWYPLQRKDDLVRLEQGMRLAGLPM